LLPLSEHRAVSSVSWSGTVGRTPWTDDQLVARPLPVHKHRKTHTYPQTLNIHALSWIRTHGPGFRASEDSASPRPLGYRDWQAVLYGRLIQCWLLHTIHDWQRWYPVRSL
jgi:hypothetical protein